MREGRVVAAGGAEAFLRYKRGLLQYLADHPPRVSISRLAAEVSPPADLPSVFKSLVSGLPARPCCAPACLVVSMPLGGPQPGWRCSCGAAGGAGVGPLVVCSSPSLLPRLACNSPNYAPLH
jgi:hypothetical protein